MSPPFGRLALHTWTLDTTLLPDAIAAARTAGFDAVELRRIDFVRGHERGLTDDGVIAEIKAGGLRVAVLGVEAGWLFATGAESKRLFDVFALSCRNAVALGCDTLMSAPGPFSGPLDDAKANLRTAGDIAAAHGVRIAVEFSAPHDALNRLDIARDLIAAAGHKSCGLLLDAYHLQRSGATGRAFADVPVEDIFVFQYSDVSAIPPDPTDKRPTDRLLPGKGVIPWHEVFGLLREKNYTGYISLEAPNPETWARPPLEVAREALAATRSLLASA